MMNTKIKVPGVVTIHQDVEVNPTYVVEVMMNKWLISIDRVGYHIHEGFWVLGLESFHDTTNIEDDRATEDQIIRYNSFKNIINYSVSMKYSTY